MHSLICTEFPPLIKYTRLHSPSPLGCTWGFLLACTEFPCGYALWIYLYFIDFFPAFKYKKHIAHLSCVALRSGTRSPTKYTHWSWHTATTGTSLHSLRSFKFGNLLLSLDIGILFVRYTPAMGMRSRPECATGGGCCPQKFLDRATITRSGGGSLGPTHTVCSSGAHHTRV